jgi:hypothetical protein
MGWRQQQALEPGQVEIVLVKSYPRVHDGTLFYCDLSVWIRDSPVITYYEGQGLCVNLMGTSKNSVL